MLFEKKNIEKELLSKRKQFIADASLLEEVKRILSDDESKREIIKNKLTNKSSTTSNGLLFHYLETDKIFHIDHIKNICIDYRLRFLDSHLFKNVIPEEAVSKIKHLESLHNTALNGFKIMAPSKLFHLKNYDDPLLFVPIGNNYYYLIHKWGNDMSGYRKLMMRPYRDMGSFVAFIALISLAFAFITPTNVLGGDMSTSVFRALSFLFIFKSLCGVTLYYCFWKGKNFNSEIWNSSYYN
jgi:hypothetical protein